MNFLKLTLLSLTFLCSIAQASLVQWDAFTLDDGKAVKDQSTGLVWLDLDLTAGLTYKQAASSFAGWEYATSTMVESLLEGIFTNINFSGPLGLVYQFEQNCANTSSCYQTAKLWQSLFGSITGSQYYQQYSYGLYADVDNIIRMGGAYVNGSGSANRYGSEFSSTFLNDLAAPLYGSFLVKSDSIAKTITLSNLPVIQASAPSSFALLCLVLPVLFMRLSKK
jgi:hypothetical protein